MHLELDSLINPFILPINDRLAMIPLRRSSLVLTDNVLLRARPFATLDPSLNMRHRIHTWTTGRTISLVMKPCFTTLHIQSWTMADGATMVLALTEVPGGEDVDTS